MFNWLSPDTPRTIRTIPIAWRSHPTSSVKQKICVVTNSDLTTGLAELLASLQQGGWAITVLDCAVTTLSAPPQSSQEVTYEMLRDVFSATAWYPPVQAAAAYHWLRQQNFDLVLCYQDGGAGFFAAMARRLGLLAMPIVAVLAQPHAMKLEQNCQFPEDYSDFEIDYLERQTASLVDGVLLADNAVKDWLGNVPWSLPSAVGQLDDMATTAMDFNTWCAALLPTPQPAASNVSITVCIATYNRPHYLREALQSLEQQSLKDFQIIVMDDGSTDPLMPQLQQEYDSLFTQRGWRWLRQENSGPAAARNAAAFLATTSHILFMDDDNLACPDELERFTLAAQSGVPIINCLLGLHPASVMSFTPLLQLPDASGSDTRPLGWIPLGGALDLAVFVNRMGDTNSLFQREIFWQLGGFQGSRAMVFEDFALLQRAAIAGISIMTIPEILLLYRRNADSRSMGSTIFTSHLESLEPLAELTPTALHPLLLYLRKSWYDRHCARRIPSTSANS